MRKEQLRKSAITLHNWVWREEPPHSKWQYCLRSFLRMCYFFYHEARENALSLRASALTYIMVLALVPLIAVGTAVLKGLGAGNQVKRTAYQLIERLDKVASPTGPPGSKPRELKSPFARQLKEVFDKVFSYVERTNFATLGAIGILGLIWAVISTLTKIEQALNQIWKVKNTRSLGRRILDYTALTVIMPVSINLVWGTLAASHVKNIVGSLDRFLPFPVLSWSFVTLMPLAILVGTFVVFYKFMPNTHVKASSALAGGIVGAVLWLMVQIAYIKLQIGIARYNAVYGSFATIPLFLIWVYWGWLAFLCGVQVSYVAQNWRGYSPQIKATPSMNLAIALDVVDEAYRRFAESRELNPNDAAERLNRPAHLVQEVMDKLHGEGIVNRTEKGGYLPAKPGSKLKLSEVMYAMWGTVAGHTRGEKLTRKAMERSGEYLDSQKIEEDA